MSSSRRCGACGVDGRGVDGASAPASDPAALLLLLSLLRSTCSVAAERLLLSSPTAALCASGRSAAAAPLPVPTSLLTLLLAVGVGLGLLAPKKPRLMPLGGCNGAAAGADCPIGMTALSAVPCGACTVCMSCGCAAAPCCSCVWPFVSAVTCGPVAASRAGAAKTKCCCCCCCCTAGGAGSLGELGGTRAAG